MGTDEAGSAERRYLRVEVTLQIKFVCLEDMEKMISGETMNLSRGGMFLCTNQVREKGQKVEILLPGPDSQPVRIHGVVRHVRSIDGHPFGLGIEFNDLQEPALRIIEGLLQRAEEGGPPRG
jgi:c-di-GMP-binding flagellar brake protein YcgR